jgi:predicted transcriptional regulator
MRNSAKRVRASGLEMAIAVVCVYVEHNAVPMARLPQLIADVDAAFLKLRKEPKRIPELVTAIPVARSIADDIV